MAPEGWLGIPTQALAVLMIVFGVLIILLPVLLPWLVGILLIVLGVAWLVGATGIDLGAGRMRRRSSEPPPRV